MKRYLIASICLAAVSLFLLCSCSRTPAVTDSPPPETVADAETEATAETEPETVSVAPVREIIDVHHLHNYHLACNGLPEASKSDETMARYLDWARNQPQIYCCDGDFIAADNIYNFIHDFSVSREDYETYLYTDSGYYMCYVDLDLLYNGTAEEVEDAFLLKNYEQWYDGHIEKEFAIKWRLRELVCATEEGKNAWFAWQEEKGYTKGCMLPTGPAKSEYMPNTWFSLTELVHRFDISRADFEAAVEQCGKYNGTTFDIDRIFDGYEELMRLQTEENLYPVEVDRLCWTGPAFAPGTEGDGTPEVVDGYPGDPEPPIEEVEVVPGADEEPVRGIDQIIPPA